MAPVSLTTQLLTVAIISLQRQLYHNRGFINQNSLLPSYDFVVVGGGTAGSVVASRLSETPSVKVLLLEAGGPITVTSDMLSTYYFYDYNWGYCTVPQKNAAFGLRNRQVPATRGKILGGSHTINNAGYSRGNRRDYDAWSSFYGARGWSFQEVLPFFLKSENNTDPKLVAANPRYHSTAGPLEVSTIPNPDPIHLRWRQAANALGWPTVDLGGDMEHQYGTSLLQCTQSATNWTRQTTASAYLEVIIEGRPNLHVLLNAHVTRVIFDQETTKTSTSTSSSPTATGVKFVLNGQTIQVAATREVILSAGAFNTPQLLMLSGIGHREHLTTVGITPLLDLPVGDNLFEHSNMPFDYLVTNQSDITWSADILYTLSLENLYQFYTRAAGPITRMPFTETYIASGINGDRDWPDIVQYLNIIQVAPSVDAVIGMYDAGKEAEWRTYLGGLLDDNRHLWLSFCPFRPRSRGTVRLASAHPLDAPLIDPAYFSDHNGGGGGGGQDLASVVRGMSIGLSIAESPLLTPYLTPYHRPVPGCRRCSGDLEGRFQSRCPSYLACVAQTYTLTTFHPVGSCRMGNASSPDAVVDERLRVLGAGRLRVVDASIMPMVPNANTNAATVMIGEKGSQMIREEYRLL